MDCSPWVVRYLCTLSFHSVILPAILSWVSYYLASLHVRLPACKMRTVTIHWIVELNKLLHVKCLVRYKNLMHFSYYFYYSERNIGNFISMSLITFF